MTKKRIVLDTNILISGLVLSSSKPQQIFDYVTENQILLISEATFAEIFQTFIRPKFDKYLSIEKRLAFIATLRQKAEIIDILEVITDCRDPKDIALRAIQNSKFKIQKYAMTEFQTLLMS